MSTAKSDVTYLAPPERLLNSFSQQLYQQLAAQNTLPTEFKRELNQFVKLVVSIQLKHRNP